MVTFASSGVGTLRVAAPVLEELVRLEFALVSIALVGCNNGGGSEPTCESGNACIWAGVGEQGYNTSNPTAHRLESELFFPEDLTFGPDNRGYLVDWNNHRIRRAELDGRLIDVMGTDYEGDGPAPPEEIDNDDPSPKLP